MNGLRFTTEWRGLPERVEPVLDRFGAKEVHLEKDITLREIRLVDEVGRLLGYTDSVHGGWVFIQETPEIRDLEAPDREMEGAA